MDKKAADEATKGNRYKVPTRLVHWPKMLVHEGIFECVEDASAVYLSFLPMSLFLRKNYRRPAHLPGPSSLCKLPDVRIIRRGDEPFRSQGSDLYFPQSSLRTFNTCAIVSNAGSMHKSQLGAEIGKILHTFTTTGRMSHL